VSSPTNELDQFAPIMSTSSNSNKNQQQPSSNFGDLFGLDLTGGSSSINNNNNSNWGSSSNDFLSNNSSNNSNPFATSQQTTPFGQQQNKLGNLRSIAQYFYFHFCYYLDK
jgi:hypothetical protein